MVAFEVALGWAAETGLAGKRIGQLELTPDYDSASGFLTLVNDKRAAVEVEVVAHPIEHHREHSLLECFVRLHVGGRHVGWRAPIHEQVLLPRVPMEITVQFDFSAF